MELSTGNLQAGLEAEFVVCPKLNKVLGKPNREFRVEVLLEPAEKVQDVRVIYERDDGNIQVKFVPKVPGTYNITLKINGDKLVSSPFTVQVKERRIDVVGELDVKGEIRKQPSGIASNGKGLIAVADIYRHCILIFSEKGDFVKKLGCYGKKPGQLSSPADVTFMNDDKILVADQLNHCIQQFNVQTGTFSKRFGKEGTGEGEFKNPVSVCMDGEGHVVAADCYNNRIQVFTKDGKYVMKFGDSGQGKLDHPLGCIHHRDRFIVSDCWNNCLKVFDSSGKFLYKIGEEGEADGQLSNPWGLCVERSGNLLVCDSSNGRIQQFTIEGRFTGKTVSKLQNPTAIATTQDGRILLSDLGEDKVYILK